MHDWLRELDVFKDDRLVFHCEGVACADLAETDCCGYATCLDLVECGLFVGVHLNNLVDAFTFAC